MDVMFVVAVDGPVPFEGDPRKLISKEQLEVPRTSYYLRRLATGELKEVPRKSKTDKKDEG